MFVCTMSVEDVNYNISFMGMGFGHCPAPSTPAPPHFGGRSSAQRERLEQVNLTPFLPSLMPRKM
jgi:hypothetical protein